MNVGIIGAGSVETGLAKQLVVKGHKVMLSFVRDPAELAAVASRFAAGAGSVAEAADFGEVVVLATPWTAAADALNQIPNSASPKILWDCTNPLKPDLSGLLVGTDTSGAEEIAKLAPWARVVNAIPPFAEALHSASLAVDGKCSSVFVCGDDQEARATVAKLVEDIGAEPIETGPLVLARYTEPAAMLLVQLAYAQGFGVRIGLSLIRETATP